MPFGGCAYGAVPYGGECGGAAGPPAIRKAIGCGAYEVYVLTRGGSSLVAVFPWTSLTFSRVLDDTSDGSAVAYQIPAECRGPLSGVTSWRHELAIYRDGQLVWVGPVVIPQAPPDQYEIAARDLSAWWDHRLIHKDHDYSSPTDLATIFQDVAADAMAPDPSPGLAVTTTPCGVTAILTLLALQHLSAATELRDIAKTGIDWTTIARKVLAGGAVVPTGPLGPFLDEHFAVPPTPKEDGTAKANAWLVRGAGGGAAGDVVYGYQTDPVSGKLDGLLESVETDSTIKDSATAQAAAKTRVALTSVVGTLDKCVLHPEAPFTLDELVPGALCQVRLEQTSIPVFGSYRLQRVDVTASAQSGGGAAGRSASLQEQIALTFQPVGTS